MTKVDYVLQEVRVPGQLHFCIQRIVYLILACNSHHYACASIAWVSLLYKQPLRGVPPRQARENVRLKNCEESPRFISSMCEHVSCKEVCLSSRRMSGLPDWCNTPEVEKGQRPQTQEVSISKVVQNIISLEIMRSLLWPFLCGVCVYFIWKPCFALTLIILWI